MDEFCPLCRKNGRNNKIKPVQLNFHEAVYLCESETCHWPYGYEEFKIIPRSIDEIGKISPKKTSTKADVQKTKDGIHVIAIPTELSSMYTPPVTPSNDNSSSKEIVKGTTTNSILHDIFNSTGATTTTIINNHNDIVSHSENCMKPPLRDSYASLNNTTSKMTNTSIITIKNENTPPKVSSIFDIDSSVIISTKKSDQSQIHTLNYNCDIRHDDEKNNKCVTLSNECRRIHSTQLPSKHLPQTQNAATTDVDIKDLKPRRKIKSTVARKSKTDSITEQLSDQSDIKLNKKVVIFKEKLSNGIVLSDEKNLSHLINRKRSSVDESNSQLISQQLPKKISKVSCNQEIYDNNKNNNALSGLLNERLIKNSVSTVESTRNNSMDNLTGSQSLIINKSEENIVTVPKVELSGCSMMSNSYEISNSIIHNSFSGDNLNFDSFIEENFLEDCPNGTQEIDDDWLQSFLM